MAYHFKLSSFLTNFLLIPFDSKFCSASCINLLRYSNFCSFVKFWLKVGLFKEVDTCSCSMADSSLFKISCKFSLSKLLDSTTSWLFISSNNGIARILGILIPLFISVTKNFILYGIPLIWYSKSTFLP